MLGALTIGVDLGGTKCLGVLLGPDGVVLGEHRLPTPRGSEAIVAAVTEVVDVLIAGCGASPVAAVGVGAPGLVDADGVLHYAPNLPGVTDLAIRQRLLARLDVSRVQVDNDATCAGWAETTMGAAVGRRHVLLATLGTGIGGGLVVDGRVVRGAHGFAGEIGHMVVNAEGPVCVCGRHGCWEYYGSGSGLGWMARQAAEAGRARRVVELAGGHPGSARGEHVTLAASQGDAEARAIMDRYAWWLALGLASLATVLDPDQIVLGGGLAESGDVLIGPVRRAFGDLLEGAVYRPEIAIVAAALGERAGAVGAALLARPEGSAGSP
jgi:glucokinase